MNAVTFVQLSTKEQTETDRLTGKDLLMKMVILNNHCISQLALAVITYKEYSPPVAPFMWEKHITNDFKILVIVKEFTKIVLAYYTEYIVSQGYIS